jgi:hypothetical protein
MNVCAHKISSFFFVKPIDDNDEMINNNENGIMFDFFTSVFLF